MLKTSLAALKIAIVLAAFTFLIGMVLSPVAPLDEVPMTGNLKTGALTFGPVPLLTPDDGATVTTPYPVFKWDEAVGGSGAISYTLRITGPAVKTYVYTTTALAYTSTINLPNGVYTWTVQARDAVTISTASPYTFNLQAARTVYLPYVHKSPCPVTSDAGFELIPIQGDRTDRPDSLHADLNLALRGYSPTLAAKTLVQYNGITDPNAPRLASLFSPNSFPGISSVYRINQWKWAAPPNPGTRGEPIDDWDVTLVGLPTTPGQKIYIPERGPEIFGGGYRAMVLYAELTRITIAYTRRDTVAEGYAVHLENVCVDPNLLALYQAQIDSNGRRILKDGNYRLPALRNEQALGTALGSEIQASIRDTGKFMDPRSCKDWWAKDVNCQALTVKVARVHNTGTDGSMEE